MASAPKQVAGIIKLVINAGQAKPSPPVGPALGQAGLNIMAFCKEFNAKTQKLKDDVPVPVFITAYKDKSFDFVIKTPPTSYFLKKAAGVPLGSHEPGHQVRGSVSLKHVYEIAKIKQEDQQYVSLESICSSIIGTAKSMGITVVPR